MLGKLIRIELVKMKSSLFPLFLVGFNILSILIGSVIFAANIEWIANDGNKSLVLWGQSSLYSSQIFFPILIGVLCAVSWQYEENDRNWQRMSTVPVKQSNLVLAKFFSIQIYTLINQGIFFLLFCLSCFILSVPEVRYLDFISWSILGWLGTFSITAIQLFLSIKLRSFTFPIILATAGAILGLMTLFVGKTLFTVFPYTQITIAMRARNPVNFSLYEFILFVGILVVWTFVGLFSALIVLKKREE